MSSTLGRGNPFATATAVRLGPATRPAGIAVGPILALALWSLFLFTSPIYLWSSGLPQVTDFIMVLLIPLALCGALTKIPRHDGVWVALITLVLWILAVNTYWYAQLGNTYLLRSAMFYLYNGLVFAVCIVLQYSSPSRFSSVTRGTLMIAVAVQIIIAVVGIGAYSGVRQAGTFNNPNQLGYWALLVTAIYFALDDNDRLRPRDVAMIVAAFCLTLLSVSKGAAGAFIIIVFATLLKRGIRGWIVMCFMAVLGFVILLAPETSQFFAQTDVGANLEYRLSRADGKVDHILAGGRGYDRIWNYPEYLFFGAGEGSYYRFDSLFGGEIHSIIGTIWFSYGTVGMVLFGVLLWAIFRHADLTSRLYLLGIFVYGLTHQGQRSTLFWVFLGIIAGLGLHRRGEDRRGLPRGEPHVAVNRLGDEAGRS